jgi:hypothetical protein
MINYFFILGKNPDYQFCKLWGLRDTHLREVIDYWLLEVISKIGDHGFGLFGLASRRSS